MANKFRKTINKKRMKCNSPRPLRRGSLALQRRNEWSRRVLVAKKRSSSMVRKATNTTTQIPQRRASELDTSAIRRRAKLVQATGPAKTCGHAAKRQPTPKQRKADTDDEEAT